MTAGKRASLVSAAATALAALIALVVLAIDHAVIAAPAWSASANTADAVLNNFAPDLLHGEDGLLPGPRFALKYGPPNTAIDVDGNAIDAHEAHLAYFEGRYWLYGREWGCGTMSFGHHRDIDASRNEQPECGIVSLSSPDLVHWRVVNRDYIPTLDDKQVGNQKPQVVWSASLHPSWTAA